MTKPKVIWIINQYSSTPDTGLAGRHYYLGQELAKKGHTVYVVAGSYSHLLHSPKIFNEPFLMEEVANNFKFIWFNLAYYTHAHSKRRILNEFSFSKKLLSLIKVIEDKPDVIIHSSPALISFFGAKYLSNYHNVPYIFEVRDPWPLTLVELGGYSFKHPFIRFLQWIEDRAYKKADYVFSNFFNAIEHMISRGMEPKKFSWIPNGISLDEVQNKEPVANSIRNKIPSNKFIVGYTGTLGEANAMSYLIEAAKIVSSHTDIHFVLVGSGRKKNILLQQSEDLGLHNITFIDPIPKIQIQSMLELFDVCYIGWQRNKMYRLGIAANKIPEYMYSAKPVIHSFSGQGDFISQASSGITVEAEDPKAIATAILKMKSLSKNERYEMGNRGKNFVLENLTYEKLANKLIDTLFKG